MSHAAASPSIERLDLQPTPLHELEGLLAAVGASKAKAAARPGATAVTDATPRVDLLLRPAERPDASSIHVVVPSPAGASSSSSSSSSELAAAGVSRVCAACQRQYAKYVCPKCNLHTCSLPCYKSHNESCTHTFATAAMAEEQVLDTALRKGLGRTRAVLGEEYTAAKQARRTAHDILQRVQNFQQEDDQRMEGVMQPDDAGNAAPTGEEEEAELQTEQRLLAALSLIEQLESKADNDAASPITNDDLLSLQSLLPPALLKDFQRSIVDGRMSAWIARWRPWWRPPLLQGDEDSEAGQAQEAAKEREIAPDNWRIPAVQLMDPADDLPASAPPLPAAVPAFSSLFPGTPSPLLPIHIVELLYAYAFVVTLYNGDIADHGEAVALMAELAPALTGRATKPAAGEAATRAAGETADDADNPSTASSSSSSAASFHPTSDLLPALHASVSSLLSSASSAPSVSTSCCWAVARLGDVCQLQCSKAMLLRALNHMQRIVEKAKQGSKEADKKKKPAAAAVAAATVSPSDRPLSLSGILRKLQFFQSFVSHVLPAASLRAWNRTLYALWCERWQMHADMHADSAAAGAADGHSNADRSNGKAEAQQGGKTSPAVQIVEEDAASNQSAAAC